jgi:hypothetical protein
MKNSSLSSLLNNSLIREMRRKIKLGHFQDLSFESAMKFILNDGLLPESGHALEGYLLLEDWLQKQSKVVQFSATDLKNKTGAVIHAALSGKTVQIIKHGKALLEIKALN